MRLMSLTHVYQSQHHENKGLQEYDQNVEDSPDRTSNDLSNATEVTVSTK